MPIFSYQALDEPDAGFAATAVTPATAGAGPAGTLALAGVVPIATGPAAAGVVPVATVPPAARAAAGAVGAVAASPACTKRPNRCRPGPGSAKICRVSESTYSSMAACGAPSAAAVPHIVQKAAARGNFFIACLLRKG